MQINRFSQDDLNTKTGGEARKKLEMVFHTVKNLNTLLQKTTSPCYVQASFSQINKPVH